MVEGDDILNIVLTANIIIILANTIMLTALMLQNIKSKKDLAKALNGAYKNESLK